MLEVTDDSGFLAVVVPATYETFVANNWTFDQIVSHFKAQMARRSLLIWGTGLEGFWKVNISLKQVDVKGVREVQGPLEVVGGSLLLTNYESLTMAAQFKHITLPERHQEDLLIPLCNGNYTCRIIQTFDPAQQECEDDGKPDFVIELLAASATTAGWETIPWFTVDG
jgi:hypothetical protein